MRTIDIHYPTGRNSIIFSTVRIEHSNDISIYETVYELKKVLLDASLKLKQADKQVRNDLT